MIFDKIRQLIGGQPAREAGPGSLTRAEAKKLLVAFLEETKPFISHYHGQPRRTETGKRILSLARPEQGTILAEVVEQLVELDRNARKIKAGGINFPIDKTWENVWGPRQQLSALAEEILKKELSLSPQQVERLAEWIGEAESHLAYYYPLTGFTDAVGQLAARNPLESGLVLKIQAILAKLALDPSDQAVRKLISRLEKAMGEGRKMPLLPCDIWTHAAITSIGALSIEKQAAWIDLLEHCAQATGAKPSGKWLKRAREIVDTGIGREEFRESLLAWFPLVDKPRPPAIAPASPTGRYYAGYVLGPLEMLEPHADVLRGLVWMCEAVPGPDIHRALMALALSSYRKIPGRGPRLIKVGNACISALGAMGGLDAIGQLAILKVRVKFGTAQAMLEKALTAAAEKEGLPREELEEMSVPAYGLTEVGRATVELGETTAELVIGEGRAVEILWKNAAGKALKSPPAAVKTDHAEDLKELRQAQKDIERMLGAQADRLDGLFLAQKSWPFSTWRERYLDHPLVGVLARRLIWKFQTGDAPALPTLWNDGRFATVDGTPLEAGDGTTVTLWHPLDSRTEDVRAWRERIESLRIRQPFKQAHREVYVLTPAEENTGTYSNRFAAHVLKQHQFNALCGQRGWKNKLRLMVDDEYPPAHRKLPGWGLRAEFWIEGLGNDYGVDTNDSGSFLYLSTDQVRFYSIETESMTAHASGGGYGARWNTAPGDSLTLSDIPPLVFSEIMRDVDLFVGVCSVGNDASWSDGGPGGLHRDYWTNYSFGELTGSAASRKEILERLVPRLKIASKCRFSDRFLIVQGALHEYKIHLGSGNILMSPDDRYLCIVARQSVSKTGETVFLPFEGDNTLSVILSKAFLLANDTAITDQTIVQQIGKLPEKG